jgi:hypothetical protein
MYEPPYPQLRSCILAPVRLHASSDRAGGGPRVRRQSWSTTHCVCHIAGLPQRVRVGPLAPRQSTCRLWFMTALNVAGEPMSVQDEQDSSWLGADESGEIDCRCYKGKIADTRSTGLLIAASASGRILPILVSRPHASSSVLPVRPGLAKSSDTSQRPPFRSIFERCGLGLPPLRERIMLLASSGVFPIVGSRTRSLSPTLQPTCARRTMTGNETFVRDHTRGNDAAVVQVVRRLGFHSSLADVLGSSEVNRRRRHAERWSPSTPPALLESVVRWLQARSTRVLARSCCCS